MATRRTFLMQTLAGVVATAQLDAMLGTVAASPQAKASMRAYRIPTTDLEISRIAYGWAGMGGNWDRQAVTAETVSKAALVINTAYENGINCFDLADIYALGKSEAALGSVLKQSPGFRNKIVLQSKCGVSLSTLPDETPPTHPPHFDFSYDHIISSVEGSLSRLGTDRLDILLLHRPDALVEPDEVAKAFDELQRSGKVRYFGVSNHTPGQIALLKKSVPQPLVTNQVEISLAHPELISDGIDANREDGRRLTQGYTGVAGTLDYCRLNDILVQASSPIRGVLGSNDASLAMKQTLQLLTSMAEQKGTTAAALALAWLLRHPAGIVPIIGTGNPKHIVENCAADRVEMTRPEWYGLLMAATGLPPLKVL